MIKIGLIGAGVMGRDHARLLAEGIAGASLAAVFDSDAARARAVAHDHGAARIFESAHDLIESDQVDAVLVASPDETHAPLVLDCIRVGKPVLCEKPLADSVEGCLAIVDAEVAVGRRLVQVGFMRRFDPGYVAMEAAARSGEIGAPIFMHCVHRNAVGPHYVTSEGVIANAAIHEIDVGRFVLGEDFVVATVMSPRASRHASHRRPQFLVLQTAGAAIMDVEASMDALYGYDVRAELLCEDGSISLAPNPPVSIRRERREGFDLNPDWRGRFVEAYRRQLHAWARSVDGGPLLGASAWDGYVASATARACLDAYASARTSSITLEAKPDLYR